MKNSCWVTDTLRWNCNANFIWVQKHLGFQITFSKKWLLCLLFCVHSFITVVQRTVIKQQHVNCSRISTGKHLTLILRASRQVPFRITTKSVLQFTSRQKMVDSGKEGLKRKFLKRMICLRAGRWQHTSTRLQYQLLTDFDYVIKEMVNVAAV